MSLNIQKIQPMFSDCHKRLNKIRKMSFESVRKIPENEKQILRNATPKRLVELAKMNCYAADKIKSELDKCFGENNYVLIAVGRSISSIAETLGSMGVEIKIIPISGLRKAEVDNISKDSLQIYKTFLVQKGLSKIDLCKNADKTYVLMDYAYYGRSLERAEKLLKKNELLGDARNLISLKINDILGEDFGKKQFSTLFQYSRFKDYSYVGKLSVYNLKDVYKQCSPDRIKEYQGNITKGLRNLFWFNVFDSMNNKNYKDIFPQKEIDAVYKHYMSPQAVRNYIAREQKKVAKISKNSK